jgi:hypothetical protein
VITHTGGCHCGRVRFEVQAPAKLRVSECNCSICSKAGYLHLVVPADRFKLLGGSDNLTSYSFNTGTAKHLFCSRCGIKRLSVNNMLSYFPDRAAVRATEKSLVESEAALMGSIRCVLGTCGAVDSAASGSSGSAQVSAQARRGSQTDESAHGSLSDRLRTADGLPVEGVAQGALRQRERRTPSFPPMGEGRILSLAVGGGVG